MKNKKVIPRSFPRGDSYLVPGALIWHPGVYGQDKTRSLNRRVACLIKLENHNQHRKLITTAHALNNYARKLFKKG